MYHDMSEETGKFIDFMLETEAFDVDSRKNKWAAATAPISPPTTSLLFWPTSTAPPGTWMWSPTRPGTPLPDYKTAKNPFVVELGVGGMETAETHSMSMEFFAWPYMDKFFGEDAGRYEFMHLLDALFLPALRHHRGRLPAPGL